MIDPFTGISEESMMLQQLKIRYRPNWLLAIPFVCSLAGFVIDWSQHFQGEEPRIFEGTIAGVLLYLVCRMCFPTCILHVFVSKRTLRRISIYQNVMRILFLLFLPGRFFFSLGPPWLHWIPTLALIGWILGLLSSLVVKCKLHCHSRHQEWFVIQRFHQNALERLASAKGGGERPGQ